MRKIFYPRETFAEGDELKPDCWIKVVNPTREDIEYLTEDLGIPEEFIADIADSEERPHNDEEENWELTVIRIPIHMGETAAGSYTTVPIGVLYSKEKKLLVSVSYHRSELMTDFIRHNRRKGNSAQTDVDFIFRLIYSSAVWYLKYLKRISTQLMEHEEALETSIRNEDLLNLMKIQRSLVYFSTSIKGNEAVVVKLKAMHRAKDYDEELAEDMSIELNQAYTTVNIYTEILTGTMDAFASVISNNVNTIMKRMTSVTILLTLPTLIASLYGMNVPLGVEDKPWAFGMIILLSIALSIGLFFLLRRIKWF